jgi:hypothetical protein
MQIRESRKKQNKPKKRWCTTQPAPTPRGVVRVRMRAWRKGGGVPLQQDAMTSAAVNGRGGGRHDDGAPRLFILRVFFTFWMGLLSQGVRAGVGRGGGGHLPLCFFSCSPHTRRHGYNVFAYISRHPFFFVKVRSPARQFCEDFVRERRKEGGHCARRSGGNCALVPRQPSVFTHTKTNK